MKKFYVFPFYAEKNILLQEMVGELAPPSPPLCPPFPYSPEYSRTFFDLGRAKQNEYSVVTLHIWLQGKLETPCKYVLISG